MLFKLHFRTVSMLHIIQAFEMQQLHCLQTTWARCCLHTNTYRCDDDCLMTIFGMFLTPYLILKKNETARILPHLSDLRTIGPGEFLIVQVQ